MNIEEKGDFIKAINTFYKLKSNYENAYSAEKNKIIELKGLGWKEKRRLFSKLVKKCINCKRPVSTIFSNKFDKDGRILSAVCGDVINPCPLNITINLGYISNLKHDIDSDKNDISKYKKNIIIDKNDQMFGYITASDAVEKFDKIKELISETTKSYEYSLQLYYDIVENSSKNEEIKILQMELYAIIDTIKAYIKEYDITINKQHISDAIELYIKEMIPKLKEFNKKKYAINYVECNEKKCNLIQVPYSISTENLEWDISVDNKQNIVSLVNGMENTTSKKKKDKTLKARPQKDTIATTNKIPKQKTMKKKKKEPENIIIDWGSSDDEKNQEPIVAVNNEPSLLGSNIEQQEEDKDE